MKFNRLVTLFWGSPFEMSQFSGLMEKTYFPIAARAEKDIILKKELATFWKDVVILMRQPPDESKLHDTARLVYTVKSSIVPSDFEDAESKVKDWDFVCIFIWPGSKRMSR